MLSFSRILLTLSGGAFGAFVIALLESLSVRRVLAEGGAPPSASAMFALILADAGVLSPVALAIASGVFVVALMAEPEKSATIVESVIAIRSNPPERVRAAALAPLVIFAVFIATVATGHVATHAVGRGDPSSSGLTMALGWVGLLMLMLMLALANLRWVWRLLARYALPFADPIITSSIALLIVVSLMALGIATGDPGGAGGLPGVGLFATLARPELDLRPVAYALIAASTSYLGGKLARLRGRYVSSAVGVIVILVGLGLTGRAARSLNGAPEITELLERAALGKISLAALRKATDRDHDGYSALFGGGDCRDDDPSINPTAIDIPGNGIDEDCSGQDALAAVAEEPSPNEPAPPEPSTADERRTYNVILITVDTLRADQGFAGYPRPVTPNLDALAARSTVFERAYSMASYTAKSMGSTMIGKYASETHRNWDHFTTYLPINRFVAQRAKAAGAHTFAGHCHYYFQWATGYQQGFESYDTSAIAPGMADNDSSITSDRLSDLAIKMLSRPDNVQLANGKRFFAWFHYFDPHAQYVHHEGSPDFASMPGAPARRTVYDEEVWFTDKHIGRVIDHVTAQPWGADTAFIITADHGEAFGDAHGVKTHGHELWESLVRVPLILYVPGRPAKRVAVKRSLIDIAPTVLDLVGAPPAEPGELRGTSLLPDTRPSLRPVERDVYLDMPEGPYNDVRRALITGATPGMKLIHFGGNRYQLFDLATDPGENEDLAKDPSKAAPVIGRMERLRSQLKEISVIGPHVGH